jgi:chromosome partitioning protein
VAVVANRVRSGKPVYAPLEKFVASLGIPFLGRVSDSDVYVEAAESGLGIYDLPPDACSNELREFLSVVRWVQGDELVEEAASNVVPIASARA